MTEKMTRCVAGRLAAVLGIAVGALAAAQTAQAALVTSGLVIELDAGADTYSDHAGTTPATNGQAVANWGDQAALGGNQFAQMNDANATRRVRGVRPCFLFLGHAGGQCERLMDNPDYSVPNA